MKKIRIVSPAKSINKKHIDFAQNWFDDGLYEVEVGENAAGEHHYFSGTDDERLSDFQNALNDEVGGLILCSRGGYGSVRILDRLKWSLFLRHPKLICGYSDVTVFHNRMNRMGYPSLHCTAPLNFEENTPEALESLRIAVFGGTNTYEFQAHELNRTGVAEDEIVGGNLAILSTLCGTDDDLDTDGKILFIEDVGEAIYAIDRMMWQLKKADKFRKLEGLIVGGMTNMKDSDVPFGKTVEQVIAESVSEYEFPVCFNFPAGHINDNRAILLGAKARLEVTRSGSTFTQKLEGV